MGPRKTSVRRVYLSGISVNCRLVFASLYSFRLRPNVESVLLRLLVIRHSADSRSLSSHLFLLPACLPSGSETLASAAPDVDTCLCARRRYLLHLCVHEV